MVAVSLVLVGDAPLRTPLLIFHTPLYLSGLVLVYAELAVGRNLELHQMHPYTGGKVDHVWGELEPGLTPVLSFHLQRRVPGR